MYSSYVESLTEPLDSIKGDVGVAKLMLGVWTIPAVTNCPAVLGDPTQGLIDECHYGSRMHILPGFLCTRSIDVALRAI